MPSHYSNPLALTSPISIDVSHYQTPTHIPGIVEQNSFTQHGVLVDVKPIRIHLGDTQWGGSPLGGSLQCGQPLGFSQSSLPQSYITIHFDLAREEEKREIQRFNNL